MKLIDSLFFDFQTCTGISQKTRIAYFYFILQTRESKEIITMLHICGGDQGRSYKCGQFTSPRFISWLQCRKVEKVHHMIMLECSLSGYTNSSIIKIYLSFQSKLHGRKSFEPLMMSKKKKDMSVITTYTSAVSGVKNMSPAFNTDPLRVFIHFFPPCSHLLLP